MGARTGNKRVFREADFDYCSSSDSEVEDELDLEVDSSMEDFINDASMSSNQESDKEEALPTKRKRGSLKKRIKNCIDSSSEDDETPKSESDKVEVDEDNSVEVNSKIVMNPKLNLDGFFDETSSDEELEKPGRKKRKHSQKAKIVKKSKISVSSDSEIDLPSPIRGEKCKKEKFRGEDCEIGTSGILEAKDNSGLKRVVPPREPAERRGRQRTTLIVCPTSLISHW